MRLKAVIQKGVGHTVYHAATLKGAKAIIDTGLVKGIMDKDGYYVSFSKNRAGDYPKFLGADLRGVQDPVVVFEFDSEAVGATKKGKPIDSFKNHDEKNDSYTDTYNYRKKLGLNYQEERVFLGEDEYLRVKKSAIKQINVILNGLTPANVHAVAEFKNDPRVKFYATIRDFMQRNSIEKPVVKVSYSDVENAVSEYIYSTDRKRKRELAVLIITYAEFDNRQEKDVMRLFFGETGKRKKSVEEYLRGD